MGAGRNRLAAQIGNALFARVMQRNRGRSFGRIALAIAVLGVVATLLIPQARSAAIVVLLLPHIFPGSIPRPLRWITTAPTVSEIRVDGAPGTMVADVYRPAGGGRHPAMIMLLGVNPLPRSDEQVATLAEGIARSGIVAVVAESEALLAGEIRLEEIDSLIALFEQLEQDPGVDPRRIGFSGFCVGGVLELLAAADSRIADRVSYVNAFSVYADTVDVLRAILGESMPSDSVPIPWAPSALTREAFLRHIISAQTTEQDRAILTRELIELTPLTATEVQALSPAGADVRALLLSHDADSIEKGIVRLPADLSERLRQLSPISSVQGLRARIFLMHDSSDTYLPVSGARKLAAALPTSIESHYTEFRLFAHVMPEGADDPARFAGEMIKLFKHINQLFLAANDESRSARP
ncbi:MAG: hypothetical protein HW416_2503 [Chloroflexi bacterium]|nr:hypothetical protein [Chloroflexota bacterium]